MTSDDELLKLLRAGTHHAEYVTLGGVEHDARCLAAEARIRELEAELDALKSDLSGYMGAANTYVNELHGVHAGTHVIVPVEPTPEMIDAVEHEWAVHADWHVLYAAMIRAAQPDASD